MSAGLYLHASVVAIGEQGVLLRGPSGSGKSSLALALLAEASRRSLFARLVGDDRVSVVRAGGRLVVRGHPRIAGLVEQRGEGLLPMVAEPAVVLGLAVDLSLAEIERLPPESAAETEIEGVFLPHLTLSARHLGLQAAARIVNFLHRIAGESGSYGSSL